MAVTEKKIRWLQDIRTLSGKGSQPLPLHKAYMRLAFLEMEKARRGEEKNSALARVRNIDARFNDIDVEKEALLDSLAQQDAARRSASHTISSEEGAALEEHKTGFNVRY